VSKPSKRASNEALIISSQPTLTVDDPKINDEVLQVSVVRFFFLRRSIFNAKQKRFIIFNVCIGLARGPCPHISSISCHFVL